MAVKCRCCTKLRPRSTHTPIPKSPITITIAPDRGGSQDKQLVVVSVLTCWLILRLCFDHRQLRRLYLVTSSARSSDIMMTVPVRHQPQRVNSGEKG